MLAHAPLE